ncbi:predicted protein [Lichtheimia corymbifera JMRC:FSU:9682]|uniref:Uncharacterized protein n=1 Tax=Lichtheimia corymbifera JMRC:FSU:9682 TaxID=1263082 RepID=A0A068RSJ7_9FUNG|nr:predicted protein [Lichtheimia corymbifera JMRC:FSU:9682]
MDRKKKRYSVPDEAFCATPPYMPDAAYLQGRDRPFYQPTPAPNTVVIHDTPTRSKNACCLGCSHVSMLWNSRMLYNLLVKCERNRQLLFITYIDMLAILL